MMRWQRTIVDDAGNIQPGASVEVRRNVPGFPLAQVFEFNDGTGPLVNPLTADLTGYVFFHAAAGFYNIEASFGPDSREWTDVPLGTAQGTDAGVIPIPTPTTYLFATPITDTDPGAGFFKLNNANPTLATQAFLDDVNSGGVNIATYLNTFDDYGDALGRGVVEIFDPTNPGGMFHQYTVTGSVVTGPGYKKLTLVYLAGTGSFVQDSEYMVVFWSRGPQGTGLQNLVEDLTPQLGGDLDTNHFDIILEGGEVPLSTGKHSMWVPAASMTARTVNGPSSETVEAGLVNDVMKRTLNFDQTTEEGAQFEIAMPTSWDRNSTMTFVPYWYASAGAGGVTFSLGCRGFSNGNPLDQNLSTLTANSTRVMNNINSIMKGPESAAFQPEHQGSENPNDGDLMSFEVKRVVADAGDTLTSDAKLIGVMVFMRIGAPNDSFGFQS